MSIAQLAYVPQIVLNNVSLESSTPQSNGTYSNISQSNDLIPNIGVPNATFTSGIGASTDPDIPNSMLISCALNNPVTPSIGILQLSPTGGSDVGNGSNVACAGDYIIGGQLLVPGLAGSGFFTAVGVDSNGLFKTNTTIDYKGKTNGSIISAPFDADNAILSGVVDESYAVIQNSAGLATIFINVTGKLNFGVSGAGGTILQIQCIGGPVPLPEINPDYVGEDNNVILCQGNLVVNTVGSAVPYYIQQDGSQFINIHFNSAQNLAANDNLVIQLTVQYPI